MAGGRGRLRWNEHDRPLAVARRRAAALLYLERRLPPGEGELRICCADGATGAWALRVLPNRRAFDWAVAALAAERAGDDAALERALARC